MGFVARVFQPSTLRMLVWPDASNAQNNMAAVSADGSTVCVLILRLNSSCSRSIALVVRALRHWLGGKQVNACSPSPGCCRANGAACAPRMRSSGYTKDSSEGSRRRPCCRPRTPLPCCSGRCSPPARSTCAKSMAGKASPQSPSISQLTSQLDPLPSVVRRFRRAKFQPHHGRHLEVGWARCPNLKPVVTAARQRARS